MDDFVAAALGAGMGLVVAVLLLVAMERWSVAPPMPAERKERMPLTEDDCTVELATLWTLAHQIANIRLEELLQAARESEHTTPADMDLLAAMLAVKRAVLAAKGGDAR